MATAERPAYVDVCDGLSSGSSDERKPGLAKERN
jgi:hypothetical protein